MGTDDLSGVDCQALRMRGPDSLNVGCSMQIATEIIKPGSVSANGVGMPASQEVMKKVLADLGIHVLDHPLIQHKVTYMRKVETGKAEENVLVKEVAVLGTYEMMRHLSLQWVEIETPIAKMEAPELAGKKPVLVPIWRAGAPMADAVASSVMPTAKVGSIGMYRNEDDIEHPHCYYDKMPDDMPEREAFVYDPMLATGWTAAGAIDILKNKYGCKKIHFMCIVAAWDGINVLRTRHPDVDLYVCVIDSHLNENNYIVPGLGDAGDRIFGTK